MSVEKLECLTEDLLDELAAVWEQSVRATHHFLREEDIACFRPLVRNCYFQAVEMYAVRKRGGRIAGFMGLDGDMLEMLFLLPEERGKGFGRAFVDYAVGKCGVRLVDVNEDNEKALQFYLHMGYEVVGRDETDAAGKPYPILHLKMREKI